MLLERKIVMGIGPDQAANNLGRKIKMGKGGFGTYYNTRESAHFVELKEVLQTHPMFGELDTKHCCSTIGCLPLWGNPPLVESVENSFSKDNYANFVSNERNVIFEPAFIEPGGDRSRKALNEYWKIVDCERADILGLFDEEKVSTQLPVRGSFLANVAFDIAQDCLKDNLRDMPAQWRKKLNDSQFQAIYYALVKSISVIYDPAATAKSATLSLLIRMLHHNSNDTEKLVICSPINEGVNNLGERATKVCKKCFGKDPTFVRIFTDGEVDS